jgi:hypothetical protein
MPDHMASSLARAAGDPKRNYVAMEVSHAGLMTRQGTIVVATVQSSIDYGEDRELDQGGAMRALVPPDLEQAVRNRSRSSEVGNE